MPTTTTKTQLPALPQGSSGNNLVLSVNDRLRRISETSATNADAAAAAQSSADTANAGLVGVMYGKNNLGDVADRPTARLVLGAVTRTSIVGTPPGTASATYSQTQMQDVINLVNAMITAFNS